MSEIFSDDKINEMRAQSPHDRMLTALMDLVFGIEDEGSPNATFPVTVSVKGQIISGQAVTFAAWSDGIKEVFREAGDERLAKALGMVTDDYMKVIAGLEAEAESRGLIAPSRGYLHLRDTKGVGGLAGFPWVRISLDSIDAWAPGVRS